MPDVEKEFLPDGYENPKQLLKDFRKKPEDYWIKKGEERALLLFHRMAERVPAYKDFLFKNGIKDHKKIKTSTDFKSIPVMSKANYLREYPLESLCWDGTMKDKSLVFTATSGSTGKPVYFPRDDILDWQCSVCCEDFLEDCIKNKKSALVIDCLGMGIWIGGLIIYQSFRRIGLRGYNLSVITPGISKKEIFNAILNLRGKFDTLILCGYPPFTKDVIDEGLTMGIKWSELNVKLLFAAEAFDEGFRDYLARKAGLKNKYLDTMNIYGSADLGAMAKETPLSIAMREMALNNSELYADFFEPASRIPTLAQFNPLFTNFEEDSGSILCTGYNALPLLRYSIGDHGGVVSFKKAEQIFTSHNVSIRKIAKEKFGGVLAELPFVYVYERSDFSVTLYGLNIYPETVRRALGEDELEEFLTGKFTMLTQNDEAQNQYLEINVELKINKTEDDLSKNVARDVIVRRLLKENSEYKKLYEEIPDRAMPKVIFHPYESAPYFTPGGKQKWVKK